MATLKSLSSTTFTLTVLSQFARRDLAGPAWHFVGGIDRERFKELLVALDEAFDLFVASKTDSDGNVVVAKKTGLLSGGANCAYDGIKFYGTVERLPAKSVRPWECAGPFVRDELGLLLRLWAENFEPIQRANDRYGFELLISAIVALNHEDADADTLVRANAILVGLISGSAADWRRRAMDLAKTAHMTAAERKSRMKAFQEAGVRTRQNEAEKGECRRLAAFYKRDFPLAKKPEVQDYVHKKVTGPEYGKKLTPKTVGRLMAGYEAEARLMITRQSGK